MKFRSDIAHEECTQNIKTCATCRHFQFKYSDKYSWGQCLRPELLERQIMVFDVGLVDEIWDHPDSAKLRQALQDYGRIYFREDAMGCILHEGKER